MLMAAVVTSTRSTQQPQWRCTHIDEDEGGQISSTLAHPNTFSPRRPQQSIYGAKPETRGDKTAIEVGPIGPTGKRK